MILGAAAANAIRCRSWTWLFLRLTLLAAPAVARESIDGRHSFSLTTFDPDGRLGQVERAVLASDRGTPVLVVVEPDGKKEGNGVRMVAPQFLPSPWTVDDGTSRFAVVTPSILMAHSGISADGRVLTAAAQRLAVEHAYTFDEPIPMGLLLRQMSLLMQEYTMKAASRPFGATLVLAEVPSAAGTVPRPRVFVVDPTGAVTRQEDVSVINERGWISEDALESLRRKLSSENDSASETPLSDGIEESMRAVVSKALHDFRKKHPTDGSEWDVYGNAHLVSATMRTSQIPTIRRTAALTESELAL